MQHNFDVDHRGVEMWPEEKNNTVLMPNMPLFFFDLTNSPSLSIHFKSFICSSYFTVFLKASCGQMFQISVWLSFTKEENTFMGNEKSGGHLVRQISVTEGSTTGQDTAGAE